MTSTTSNVPDATNHADSVDATQLPARERWRRAFTALGRVLRNPDETDQVLVFSTYANAGTMPGRIHRFLDNPQGKQLFEQRRTIDAHSIDLLALGTLPVGTLGRAYSDFLTSRGFSPDVFEGTPDNVSDPGMAYVIQRLRQTHDLWHVVTGYNTDPASEVALQAFTFGQLRAPSSGILALLGTLRGSQLDRTLAIDVLRAYRLGARSKKLAVFPWEDHWTTPLVEVRAMLDLPATTETADALDRKVRAAVAKIEAAGPTAPTHANHWIAAARTAAEPATSPTLAA